jgi:hypothetical protein
MIFKFFIHVLFSVNFNLKQLLHIQALIFFESFGLDTNIKQSSLYLQFSCPASLIEISNNMFLNYASKDFHRKKNKNYFNISFANVLFHFCFVFS